MSPWNSSYPSKSVFYEYKNMIFLVECRTLLPGLFLIILFYFIIIFLLFYLSISLTLSLYLSIYLYVLIIPLVPNPHTHTRTHTHRERHTQTHTPLNSIPLSSPSFPYTSIHSTHPLVFSSCSPFSAKVPPSHSAPLSLLSLPLSLSLS